MDRKTLKENAKLAFKANYWRSVVVALISTLVAGGSVAVSGGSSVTVNGNPSQSPELQQMLQNPTEEQKQAILIIFGVVLGFVVLLSFVSFLMGIFLTEPVQMGCKSFFVKNSDDPETTVEEVKTGFTPNYMRNVKAFFLKRLYTFLWSLLFVIPGIIKAMGYVMVPYILADNPDIEAKEALAQSTEMMKGHKWEYFVLVLSFLGWGILSALTLGILGIFYVNPYEDATFAEYYKALKEEY